ncbi:uncharacterized protein BDZ99DRAFT_465284 [Mytilinidion resinicola]|uniref:Uncharacterized protein n=1 Tax=Mytilinidion resinicola TaxID=574789 RepID=A0A6A6YFM3_9PEZI|nr:uncharacterized protein BDZ99DRAFT_465284 [Mytilinidion resinicola]KAF2807399.1 hypothetical protein BDZ99DRAFT_465284 [Mytilinidion resinicola]
MIWAYAVIPNEGHILADIWAFRTQPISALSPTFIPAICRANRQIQSEAFPLFLPLAKFHITSCGRIPFTKWLESFPDYEGFAAVRHLNFSYIFNGFWKSQLSLMLQCAGLRTVELTIPLELCLLPSRPAGSTFPNQGENLIGEKQLGGLLECENLELVVLECFAIYPSDPQIRAMLKGRAIATAEWLEEGFRRRRMKTFVCRTVTVKMHYDGAYHTAGIGS